MNGIELIQEIIDRDKKFIVCRSTAKGAKCPKCGSISYSIHSNYNRIVSDISLDGIHTEMLIKAKKFKCKSDVCTRKIFSERITGLQSYQRRTDLVNKFVLELGLITSAEKTSKFMTNLGIKISHDSVLRIIKQLPGYETEIQLDSSICHIGVDDFALKKSSNYGTIICDLDSKKIVEILPDRTKECVSAWLAKYPHIKIVSRDGSIAYSAAIQNALPNALQISDKFHLIKNLLDAVNSYISRTYPVHIPIEGMPDKEVLDTSERIIDECIKTSKELIRNEKIELKWSLILEIQQKHKEGVSRRQLAKEYSLARNTIKKYLDATQPPTYTRNKPFNKSKFEPYKEIIIKMLGNGSTHQQISDHLNSIGLVNARNSLSVYISTRGITSKKCISNKSLLPLTTTKESLIKSLCKNVSNLSNIQASELEKIKKLDEKIKLLHEIVTDFKGLFKGNTPYDIDIWIERAKTLEIPEVNRFITGISRDLKAVKNAIEYSYTYTNGLLEGMVNKLKVIKRISYGRCNFKLLRIKVLNA